jgi:hypothetical protein
MLIRNNRISYSRFSAVRGSKKARLKYEYCKKVVEMLLMKEYQVLKGDKRRTIPKKTGYCKKSNYPFFSIKRIVFIKF